MVCVYIVIIWCRCYCIKDKLLGNVNFFSSSWCMGHQFSLLGTVVMPHTFNPNDINSSLIKQAEPRLIYYETTDLSVSLSFIIPAVSMSELTC